MGYMYSCIYLESVRILMLHEMGINVPEDSKMRVKMSVFILHFRGIVFSINTNVSKLIYMYIIAKAF